MLSTPHGLIYTDEFAKRISEVAHRVNQVTIVIEACYSGSFARRLLYPRNVFILTASTAREPSYAYSWCYRLKTYTTDEFTYHLLSYLDDPANNGKPMKDLIQYVKGHTTLSTVLAVGNVPEWSFGKGCARSVLGNVSISNVRRIKNTLDPQYKGRLRRIHGWLLLNVGDDGGIKSPRRTIVPDESFECYKNITSMYYGCDNIEAIHKLGLLCVSYSTDDIVRAIVLNH
jgi:hypothetical protein